VHKKCYNLTPYQTSLAQSSQSLLTEAEILSKHLYCGHLVAYHSVNMAASEKFHASPPSATKQNSMYRQTMAQEQFGDIKLCILESSPFKQDKRYSLVSTCCLCPLAS